MLKGYVLSLCDFTGNQVKPWADAGYRCYCVDLAHPPGETYTDNSNIVLVGADVRTWVPFKLPYSIVFSAPPCTDVAVSGARWFPDKGVPNLLAALEVLEACKRIAEWTQVWTGAPWMIENPVSVFSSYWRKPNFIFNPNQYAGYLEDPSTDAYTKKTCIWHSTNFRVPEQKPVPAILGSKMHLMGPSEDRAAKRAETPMGFSRAVFQANS